MIREDQELLLLRGHRVIDLLPILALTPRQESASAPVIRRLKNEFSLSSQLNSGWAAKPFELLSHGEKLMLLFEDPGGQPLDIRLVRRVDWTECLRIAIGLADALVRMHARGVVHKDIRPANI